MSALSGILLLILLVTTPPLEASGQESLPVNNQQTTEAAEGERIVEGRPPFYTLKRWAHPLSWVELAVEPVFRSAENGWIHRAITIKPQTEHIRGGVSGAGSGSGFGPQLTLFHTDLLGRGIDVEVPLLYTYKQYEVYQLNARIPVVSRGSRRRLTFDFGTGYASRASDDFFGIGNDSRLENERQFRTVTREASAGLTGNFDDDWFAGLAGNYRRVGVTKPATGVSAQEHFDDSSAPGLYGATLGSLILSIGRDNRMRDDYAFTGGSDRLEISFNESVGGGDFRYWRYRLHSQHFFALTDDGRKAIAVKGLLETNRPAAGQSVPFFEMPVLGTAQTLRGFENFRFRDRTALALTLEYRYRIWRAMDLGLFVDEGQVGPQLGDLGLSRFHTGYGVRLFLWSRPNSPISFDYGRSSETWRLYVNFNASF